MFDVQQSFTGNNDKLWETKRVQDLKIPNTPQTRVFVS